MADRSWRTEGIDLQNGQCRWRVSDEEISLLAIVEDVAIVFDSGLSGLNVKTGERLWHRPSSWWAGSWELAGIVVVACSEGTLGIDPKSGDPIWVRDRYLRKRTEDAPHLDLPEPSHTSACFGDTFLHFDEVTHAIDRSGATLWTADGLNFVPLWEGNGITVTRDEHRLFGFRRTPNFWRPESREERRALARKLAGSLNELSNTELHRLADLGDDAVDAILDILVDRYLGIEAEVPPNRRSTALLEPPPLVQTLLLRTLGPSSTSALFRHIEALPPASEGRKVLLWHLLNGPDPGEAARRLADFVGEVGRTEWEDRSDVRAALAVLCYLPCPEGITLLVDALHDARVGQATRRQFYQTISRTGPIAASAVVRMRNSCAVNYAYWPDVTRRAETDLERAIEAAFDACVHDPMSGPAQLQFPRGIEPFAIASAQSVFRTVPNAFPSDPNHRLVTLDLEYSVPRLDIYPENATLSVFVTVYGQIGDVVTVQKLEGEWIPINVEEDDYFD